MRFDFLFKVSGNAQGTPDNVTTPVTQTTDPLLSSFTTQTFDKNATKNTSDVFNSTSMPQGFNSTMTFQELNTTNTKNGSELQFNVTDYSVLLNQSGVVNIQIFIMINYYKIFKENQTLEPTFNNSLPILLQLIPDQMKTLQTALLAKNQTLFESLPMNETIKEMLKTIVILSNVTQFNKLPLDRSIYE